MKKHLFFLVLLNISFLGIVAADKVAGPADTSLETLTNASKKRKPVETHQLNKSDGSENKKRNAIEEGREEELDSCGICLDTLEDDIFTLPIKNGSCGHKFHKYCLKQWHRVSKTCPGCRTETTVTLTFTLKELFNSGYRLPHSTRTLILSNHGLTSLENAETLLPIDKIHKLIAGNNCLTKIPPTLLPAFTHLTYLSLYNNRFTELQSGMFKDVPKLRTLILAFNRLNTIPSKAFLGLKDLRNLSFYGNRIRAIKDDAFAVSDDGDECIPLENLNLSNNWSTSVNTKALVGLTQLQKLGLCRNNIHEADQAKIKSTVPEGCIVSF